MLDYIYIFIHEIYHYWQVKVVAEDHETADYAQHRLPAIIPVYATCVYDIM